MALARTALARRADDLRELTVGLCMSVTGSLVQEASNIAGMRMLFDRVGVAFAECSRICPGRSVWGWAARGEARTVGGGSRSRGGASELGGRTLAAVGGGCGADHFADDRTGLGGELEEGAEDLDVERSAFDLLA